jgi:hypothetical protein
VVDSAEVVARMVLTAKNNNVVKSAAPCLGGVVARPVHGEEVREGDHLGVPRHLHRLRVPALPAAHLRGIAVQVDLEQHTLKPGDRLYGGGGEKRRRRRRRRRSSRVETRRFQGYGSTGLNVYKPRLVRGVLREARAVPHRRAEDAGDAPEHLLGSPEAAGGEDARLEVVGEGLLDGVVQHEVVVLQAVERYKLTQR